MNAGSGFVFEFAGEPAAIDEAATDLVAWFDDDERLRGAAETRMTPAAAGEMGGLADAAKVALGAAGPVAKAFGTWLADRVRNKGQVKLSVTRDGGASFAVEASSVAQIEALMPQIHAFFAAGASPALPSPLPSTSSPSPSASVE
jgi:hypothetical protein